MNGLQTDLQLVLVSTQNRLCFLILLSCTNVEVNCKEWQFYCPVLVTADRGNYVQKPELFPLVLN